MPARPPVFNVRQVFDGDKKSFQRWSKISNHGQNFFNGGTIFRSEKFSTKVRIFSTGTKKVFDADEKVFNGGQKFSTPTKIVFNGGTIGPP